MDVSIFEHQGFAIVDAVLTARQLSVVEKAVSRLKRNGSGTRTLLNYWWCRKLAQVLKGHPRLKPLLPEQAVAVQCTLFEKSTERNWLVPLHQDLHIAVRERVGDPSLSGWCVKEGGLHVQAPAELLERLVAVRVHLDASGPDHGALRVVSGSHLLGRLSARAIGVSRKATGERLCLVGRGGALIMKPLLLHASSKARVPNRRRVLHFLFGPAELANGLRWRYDV
jgi:hypothetical protein